MEGKIYGAISNIMDDITAVGKNSVNEQQRFKFRGIDDVMNALKPLLAKHRVFVVPTVLEQTREERKTARGNNLIYSVMKVKYTYFTEDGSYIESVVIGEGMDSGDKASNKALAIAFKYSLFQTFCIPTEEMKDPDSETHEASTPINKEDKLNEMMIKTIEKEMNRTGYNEQQVAGMCKESTLSEIPVKYYKAVMDRLKKCPDRSDS